MMDNSDFLGTDIPFEVVLPEEPFMKVRKKRERERERERREIKWKRIIMSEMYLMCVYITTGGTERRD